MKCSFYLYDCSECWSCLLLFTLYHCCYFLHWRAGTADWFMADYLMEAVIWIVVSINVLTIQCNQTFLTVRLYKERTHHQHISGDNSYSVSRQFIKNSIGCKDQMVFFCCHLRETYVKTKKRRKVFMKPQCKSYTWDFKDYNSLITSLCIEYIGEFMALNQKDPMLFL